MRSTYLKSIERERDMATNYSITVDVIANLASLQQQLNGQTYTIHVDGVQDATSQTQDLTGENEKLGESVDKTGFTYQQFRLILDTCVSVLSDMYENTKALNDAMTEMNKVAQMSGSELDAYSDRLYEIGQKVARTTSEMAEGATQWIKSGYSPEEAANLAYYSALLQNISDDSLSASDATATLISQIKAFGMGTEDVGHIIDSYNAVAHSFSVGTNDIQNAMEVAGAGLATYGNSFEETMGLVVAGTEIMVGRSSQVARGLNTIAAHIRTSEDVLSQYGISVKKSSGELKSTYEVLSELSKVWGTLGDTAKQELGQTLAGGVNQYKVLAAVMSNFAASGKAVEIALNSAGSAMESNAIYMDSLEAKENQLSAVFEDFSNRVLSSEFVGSLTEAGTALLKFVDGDVGAAVAQITLIGGALFGLIGIITQLAKSMRGLLATLSIVLKKMDIEISTSGVGLALVGIATAIAGVIWAVQAIQKAQYENSLQGIQESLSSTQSKIEETNTSLENYKKRLDELNKVEEKDRGKSWRDERAEIEANIKRTEYYLELYKQQQKVAAEKLKNKMLDDGIEVGSRINPWNVGREVGFGETLYYAHITPISAEQYDALQSLVGKTFSSDVEAATAAVEALGDSFNWSAVTAEDADERFEQISRVLRQMGIKIEPVTETVGNALYNMQQLAKTLDETSGEAEKETARMYLDALKSLYEFGQLTGEPLTIYEDLSAALENASQKTDDFSSATQFSNISIKNYVAGLLAEKTAAGETGKSLYDLVAEIIILNNTNLDLSSQIAAIEELGRAAGASETALAKAREMAYIKGMPLSDVWGFLSGGDGDKETKKTGGGGGGSKADTELEQHKEVVATLKSELTLMQKKNVSQEEQNKKMRQIQNALHAQAQYLRSIGAKESEINALSAEWYDWQEKINGALHDSNYYLDELKSALSNMVDGTSDSSDYSSSYADTVSSANDKLSQQLELEEKILAVQKAQEALENAQRERTVRQYNAATGKWEWVSNKQAVEAAKESLTAADRALTEYKIQMAEDAINKEYSARQSSVSQGNSAIKSAYEKFVDSLKEPERGIEEILRDLWKTATPELKKTILANSELFKQLGIDLEQLIRSIENAENNFSSGAVGAAQALRSGDTATAQKLLNQAVGLYDSGGVLQGVGGIKATVDDEIVLPPSISSAMLHPSANSQFQERLAELGYLYGAKSSMPSTAYRNYAQTTNNQNSVVYNINGVALTDTQAKSTSVYELAQISRSLAIQNNRL